MGATPRRPAARRQSSIPDQSNPGTFAPHCDAPSEEMTSAIQSVTESTGQVVESVTSIQAASKETTKAAEAIARAMSEPHCAPTKSSLIDVSK